MIGRKRNSAALRIASFRLELLVALGRDGEVDHHDAVLLDDADQEHDADQGDQAEIEPERIRMASAPTPADGSVDRIVIGWM